MNDDDSKFTEVFRFISLSIALFGGLLVGATTIYVGASWWSLPVCIAISIVIGKILPIEYSTGWLGQSIIAVGRTTRAMPSLAGIIVTIGLVGLFCSAFYIWKNMSLVTAFYLFIAPIFVITLLFGQRLGILAALLCTAAVVYFAIPPRQSFAITTLQDAVYFFVFAAMALVIVALLTFQSGLWQAEDAGKIAHSKTK